MRNRFDEQLELLHAELITMGGLCEQVISKTYHVILEESLEAAKEIQERDSLIDQKERDIERLCFKLLLQQQPVARDLRKISAALKMITDMERIGDQASDIAEIVETGNFSDQSGRFKQSKSRLGEMAEATIHMVTSSIDAYVKQDLKIAQDVIEYDDVVDDLFVDIRAQLIEEINGDARSKEQALDMLMIAKYYERIGDHATNIAEWVEFSIIGEHRSGKNI